MKSNPARDARLAGLGTTIFAEMTRLAIEHGAVNLSQGFPDFAGPRFIKDAAVEAIRGELNQYARMQGVLPLVRAIAQDLRKRRGLHYDAESEITVFNGATEAIHCALMALTGPGDEVLMLEPYYDSYLACCSLAASTPRFVTLHAPAFRWDEAELRAAFNSRTRVLLLNTPHNPTGRVLSRAELELLAKLCREHDVICVTDEVYDRLVYEGEHVCMAELEGMRERTVVLNSTGKTFSLTGWKIGYACAPKELAAQLAAVHQYVSFSVATPLQHAMTRAIEAPASYFDALRASYRAKRDFLVEVLRECGFELQPPQGTYFVMADIRPLGFDDDVVFCRHLMEHIGVAAIPPSALYHHREAGRHLVRFAFSKRDETLQAAAERLRRLGRG